jgi:cell division protein FtsL
MTITSGRQRLLTIFVALMIPLAVLVTTWSGLHRHLLAEELRTLEHEQTAWLERNKRLLASIAIYRSPQRIAELAGRELGLTPISPAHVTIVEPAAAAGAQPQGTASR